MTETTKKRRKRRGEIHYLSSQQTYYGANRSSISFNSTRGRNCGGSWENDAFRVLLDRRSRTQDGDGRAPEKEELRILKRSQGPLVMTLGLKRG